MTAEKHSVALLLGEITVEQQLAVLNRFRDGQEKLLITTNLCARGIDVEQVRHVCKANLEGVSVHSIQAIEGQIL